MPLSDHEQRVLEQMEQALYAEDPRFASNLKSTGQAKVARRRAAVGVVIALAGLGLVVLSVVLQQIWIGGLGFGAMVLGGAWVFAPAPDKKQTLGAVKPDGSVKPGPKSARSSKPAKKNSSGGFMQRMEQRWEKRRDEGNSF
ncbi:DUF3040 domain-containing protein [Ornithinimicrobium sp. Arc0846-15]|nr:DUF3040 domain-containing protein [Ornithinimicrobium laminariae]